MTVPAKDQMHCRQAALNMAISTHEGTGDSALVVTSAQKYFEFMANAAPAAPMAVNFRSPSGLPDNWTGAPPLPADTLDSIMVEEVSTVDLQEMRRRMLFELDAISNALKARGVVPN